MEQAPVMLFSAEQGRSAMPVDEDWSLLQASPPVLVALTSRLFRSLAVMVESVIPKEKVESRMPVDAHRIDIVSGTGGISLEDPSIDCGLQTQTTHLCVEVFNTRAV